MTEGFVELGRVVRAHGLGGAFIISAHTENPAAILKGAGLELWSPDGSDRRGAEGLKGRTAGNGLIVKIPGLSRREEASALKGWRLVMPRALLPPLPEDEVYWADLLGLSVETRQGQALGRVERLMEAGAGLLLAVIGPGGREGLIPFQPEFVADLDLASGRLVIDPPPGLMETQNLPSGHIP
ncbi:MAG: ribosome maturation factor RimM [Deltaproteobacteria bacterium]|nr:ribosome maturation factor RimM [Deltaproteobacteria bacterium]